MSPNSNFIWYEEISIFDWIFTKQIVNYSTKKKMRWKSCDPILLKIVMPGTSGMTPQSSYSSVAADFTNDGYVDYCKISKFWHDWHISNTFDIVWHLKFWWEAYHLFFLLLLFSYKVILYYNGQVSLYTSNGSSNYEYSENSWLSNGIPQYGDEYGSGGYYFGDW